MFLNTFVLKNCVGDDYVNFQYLKEANCVAILVSFLDRA